jgi:hypothetical protein
MFGLDDILQIFNVINSLSSIARTAQSFAAPSQPSQSSGGGVPTPPMPNLTQQALTALPQQKADTAAKLGGGVSPEFLANLLGDQVGDPSAGLGVLTDIRRSLGTGAQV